MFKRVRQDLAANTTGTKLFLFEQKDASEAPIFDINNFKLGGKVNDRIFVKLTNPVTSRFEDMKQKLS